MVKRVTYSSSDLLHLKQISHKSTACISLLSNHVWDIRVLRKLGISKATRRGCRAGKRDKCFGTSHLRNRTLHKNLPVPDQNNAKESLKIGLFNARSLSNKVGLVIKLIKECSLDLLCVTETWLKKNDQAKTRKIHELGFEICSKPRLSRGGGCFGSYKV